MAGVLGSTGMSDSPSFRVFTSVWFRSLLFVAMNLIVIM